MCTIYLAFTITREGEGFQSIFVDCSDLKNPDDDDSLGVEDGGGGDEEVQAGGEEDRRSEQPVSGEARG